MDKFVQPFDKECMKMAMLKHEQTFKEQVYELHRLYQIQKMLMKNMRRSRPQVQNQENWNSNNGTICFKYQNDHNLQHQNKSQMQQKKYFDLEQPAAKEHDHIRKTLDDDHEEMEIVDESEIELTLGPTSYNRRRRRNKPESATPLTSDSVPSFSSSSTGSSHMKRVERITRENSSFLSGGRNNSSSSSAIEEHMRQAADRSLKQPAWLCQALSLNMT